MQDPRVLPEDDRHVRTDDVRLERLSPASDPARLVGIEGRPLWPPWLSELQVESHATTF
jgi:hypothetical protein